jgi:hypothetical protein
MQIYNLIVETTRKCNMKCAHCLRGNAQNLTMKDKYMYELLSQVDYISNVTFSGGEPTLPSAMKVIERFMEICNQLNVDVGSFYIVTNGKVWRNKLPELINRLYNFCDDNEISTIDISGDKFHETDERERNHFKYRLEEELEYKYGITEIVSIRPDIDYSTVIQEGRGVDVGYGRINEPEEIEIDEFYEDEIVINEGNIYLNCKGNIVKGCNWSYKSQDKKENILCKVSDNIEECLKENVEYA